MRQELDEHGFRFHIGPRRPVNRAVSRSGTRKRSLPGNPALKKGRPNRDAPGVLLFLFVLLAETLDPTGGIDQLLLTGVKGMA